VREISKLLRDLRGKKTLREASKLTGLSHSYIGFCENGINSYGKELTFTPDVLYKFSVGYQYPYIELMRVAGILPPSIKQSLDVLDDQTELKIGDVVLSPKQKEQLITMIKTFFVPK
jgi:hypothetical protein